MSVVVNDMPTLDAKIYVGPGRKTQRLADKLSPVVNRYAVGMFGACRM